MKIANGALSPEETSMFKDSEAEFYALVEIAPVLVWIADSSGQFTYFNKTWLKFTGRRLDQELGHGWREGVHKDDSERCARVYSQAAATKKRFKIEYRLRHKDGHYHWVLDAGVPRYSPNKEFLGYVGSCLDITDIKEATAIQKQNQTKLRTLVHEQTTALRENNRVLKKEIAERRTAEKLLEYQSGKVERQKNRLMAIFDNVDEQVLITDSACRIILANRSCVKLTGLSFKELKGKKIHAVFKCRDKNNLTYPQFDSLKSVFKNTRETSYSEHLHKDLNGKKIWVGVSATPILNNDGEVHQIVEVVRDITAIKDLEKAKSEFVSMASHELRTPLTVINGYLSLLLNGDLGSLDESSGQENFIKILHKVYNETRRVTKLAEELLNVSRIENGKIKLVPKPLALEDLIDDVFSEFQTMAVEKNINLKLVNKLNGHATQNYLLADRDKLKQILVNLLDNAIKYTPDNGNVKVTYFEKNGFMCTEIKDNGTGISPTILPNIFEKFQQGSGLLKENKGTGLGLFIVKSLVELHRGKIWVKSKPGIGSTFTFALPFKGTKRPS